MIAQAQADAAAGKQTLAITDPRMSRILDKLFPEKGATQRSQSGQRSKEKEGPSPDGKSSRKAPGGDKETASRSKQAIEDYRNAMRELRDPNTPEERRKALRNSLAVNAGFLALLGLTFQKDKDIPPPGGSKASADDRGAVWIDTVNWTPTDTDSKTQPVHLKNQLKNLTS
jgi:hypothetical protein